MVEMQKYFITDLCKLNRFHVGTVSIPLTPLPYTSNWLIQLAPNLTFNYATYSNRFRGRCANYASFIAGYIRPGPGDSPFIDQLHVCHISDVDKAGCTSRILCENEIKILHTLRIIVFIMFLTFYYQCIGIICYIVYLVLCNINII